MNNKNIILVLSLTLLIFGLSFQNGIITDSTNSVSADRVANWLSAGIFIQEDYVQQQGPAILNNLYIDSTTTYDFRVRSILNTGRRSDWAYYSEQVSDWTPTAPYGTYFIVAPDGNSIQNGVGTLTVEAKQKTASGVTDVGTPSTVQLYLAVNPYTNYGYSASF